jgi:hypothetical protein
MSLTKIGGPRPMPEQPPVLVLDLRKLGLAEAFRFVLSLNPEDVLQSIPDVVGVAGGIDQVVLDRLVLVRLAINRLTL